MKDMNKLLLIGQYSIVEPLGLMHLATVAKEGGWMPRIRLLEKTVQTDEFLKILLELRPDIAGFNVYTGNHKLMFGLSQLAREKGIKTILGGAHTTYFAEDCKDYGDFIVQGEGFESLRKILRNEAAPGIVFTKQLVKDIPQADRFGFYEDNPAHKSNPIKNIITSLGCPFSCSYCYNNSYKLLYPGVPVRKRLIEDIIEECRSVKQFDTKMIFFQDDYFGFDLDWLKSFVEAYSKLAMPFHAQIRPEGATTERIKLLKKAGCVSVTVALESADDNIRHNILHRKMSLDTMYCACETIKKNGLKLRTEQMIGVPGGNIDTDLATLEMNVNIMPDIAWCSIFTPYRGTLLGEYSVKQGLYSGNNDDLPDSFFERSVLNFDEKYKRQLIVLQRLFSIFAHMPKGHLFARKFLESDLSLDQLGELSRRHLYDAHLFELGINPNSKS